MKRATLRELRQDEATAKRQVRRLQRWVKEHPGLPECTPSRVLLNTAQAMLRNISQAIKRREKEKRA